MTCIAAWIEDGRVWVGGDSAGVSDYDLEIRADEKVFRLGPYVIGFTTSFRMGQVLRYTTLPVPSGWDVNKFMATTFIDAVRERLKAAGFSRLDSGKESGGTFLVAWRDRLFTVFDDYQVAAPRAPYMAVGCGHAAARGALHALAATYPRLAPGQKVEAALAAAEACSAGVRAPFVVMSTELP